MAAAKAAICHHGNAEGDAEWRRAAMTPATYQPLLITMSAIVTGSNVQVTGIPSAR
jgi:hypothetical protein